MKIIKTTYKSFDLIKLCFLYGSIVIFIIFYILNNNSENFHKFQRYFTFIQKKIINSYIVSLLKCIIK
jgi:hypothetical protein